MERWEVTAPPAPAVAAVAEPAEKIPGEHATTGEVLVEEEAREVVTGWPVSPEPSAERRWP